MIDLVFTGEDLFFFVSSIFILGVLLGALLCTLLNGQQ